MDQKRRDYTVEFTSGATLSIKAQNYPERGRIFKTKLQTIKIFMAAVVNLDNDELENHVDQQCFIDRWLKKDMLSGDGIHATNSFDPTKPIDRVFDALGSNHNRAVLVIAEKQLNAIRGQLWRLNDPYSIEGTFNPALDSAVESDEAATELMGLLANIFFVSN
ncbi:uncharacterized protein MYCFIDRAFT_77831 [Neofusicoccum parvum]|nr:uncharacterized protein MYCFIDRAFT_77831 [Neofusicoccum parvum]